MNRWSRRRFLAASALASTTLPVSLWPEVARAAATVDADLPDMVVLNARIFTSDPSRPTATAFTIRQGRIGLVGSTDELAPLVRKGVPVFDASGHAILPGLIDAHCHPGDPEELYDVHCDLGSINAIQEALRARVAETPPGYWIRGFKFDDTKLVDGRRLSRRDLDAVSREHPVRVDHRGGHTTWFNSKAFELAGISRDTADPPHGRYVRDDQGELQGLVAEDARTVFESVGLRPKFTPEQRRERARAGVAYMSKKLVAAGLTTVHDAWVDSDKLRAYQDARDTGELLHRAVAMPYGMGAGSTYSHLLEGGARTGLGDPFLRIGAVKFSADGSASERTMRMSTPYEGRPGDFGLLTMDQADIHAAVEQAHRQGWQVAIHANGDVAIDMVLQAYERVLKLWPRAECRHRLEHCTLVNPSLIDRIKATGSIPTPFWTYVYYHGEKWREYGDEKVRWMFAHRSFLDAGIPVPGASDYTPGPFDPMMALQSMVTRTDYTGRVWGAEQRVSVPEALRIATANGAWASHEENVKGSISRGKYADFVVLDQDPHQTNPFHLKDIRVLRTYVDGKLVHG
ncbi:MAG: N-substituted formamide deformylase precursor [Pseudomonadota bacterium]